MKKLIFALLVALVAAMVLAIPFGAMAQESATPAPQWAAGLSARDAACAARVLESYGNVIEFVAPPMPGGADGSPSPTLSLLAELPGTVSQVEFDRYESRSFVLRGGESGEIAPTNRSVLVVVLMDAARQFSTFWSDPLRGVVEPGGQPLGSVGVEVLNGTAKSATITVFRDGIQNSQVEGAMSPQAGVGTVFTAPTQLSGLDQSSWGPGNLAGVGVPIGADGCWWMVLSGIVPENAILSVGVGTRQTRYTRVAEVQVPAVAQATQTPSNTPANTPMPAPTQTVVAPSLSPEEACRHQGGTPLFLRDGSWATCGMG